MTACTVHCGYCGYCTTGWAVNAICSQCGADYYHGRDDVGSLCDLCCSRRDALAEYDRQASLRMAKATLPRKVRTV